MAYPSKQPELYAMMRERLSVLSPGGRLSSERVLAGELGVTRKALRVCLARLERERLIMRTPLGTFRQLEGSAVSEEPITILLPCPDYQFSCDMGSLYVHRQMFLGALKVAVSHGRHVVTIPVSETNDPANINWGQLESLHEGSMVMFCGNWFRQVISFLEKRGCRLALLDVDLSPLDHVLGVPWFAMAMRGHMDDMRRLVGHLADKGCHRPQWFGSDSSCMSCTCREIFRESCQACHLDWKESSFCGYASSLSLRERLHMLKKLYEEHPFDGLLVEMNPCIFPDEPIDFRHVVGLPRDVPILSSVNTLFLRPPYQPHAEIYYEPVLEAAVRMASFLVSSGQSGIADKLGISWLEPEEFVRQNQWKL